METVSIKLIYFKLHKHYLFTKIRCFGILLILGAIYTANAANEEVKYRKIYGASEYLSSELLNSKEIPQKVGYLTTREVLTRCIVTTSSIWFDLLSPKRRSLISRNCEEFAKKTIAVGGRHAEAHLILANLALSDANIYLTLKHLEVSAKFAPVDRFNLEWRLLIANRIFEAQHDVLPYSECSDDLRKLRQNSQSSKVLTMLLDIKSFVLKKCT